MWRCRGAVDETQFDCYETLKRGYTRTNTYGQKMRVLREWMRIPKKKGRKDGTDGRLLCVFVVQRP